MKGMKRKGNVYSRFFRAICTFSVLFPIELNFYKYFRRLNKVKFVLQQNECEKYENIAFMVYSKVVLSSFGDLKDVFGGASIK